jgi:hypothetical protein
MRTRLLLSDLQRWDGIRGRVVWLPLPGIALSPLAVCLLIFSLGGGGAVLFKKLDAHSAKLAICALKCNDTILHGTGIGVTTASSQGTIYKMYQRAQ